MRHEQNEGDGVDWGIDVRDQVCTPYTSFVDYYDDYLSSCNDDVATAFNATTSEWVKVIILAKEEKRKKWIFVRIFRCCRRVVLFRFYFFISGVPLSSGACWTCAIQEVWWISTGTVKWGREREWEYKDDKIQTQDFMFYRRGLDACVCVLRIAHCGGVGCGLQAYHTLTHAADNNSHNNLYLHNILPVSHSRIFIISHLFSWFCVVVVFFLSPGPLSLAGKYISFRLLLPKRTKAFSSIWWAHRHTHTRHEVDIVEIHCCQTDEILTDNDARWGQPKEGKNYENWRRRNESPKLLHSASL